jgi:hypothetical protein
MKLGLHIDSCMWAGDPAAIGSTLRRIATTAEETGFARLSVTDYVLRALRELGFELVLGAVPDVETITPLETLGAKVLPGVAAW